MQAFHAAGDPGQLAGMLAFAGAQHPGCHRRGCRRINYNSTSIQAAAAAYCVTTNLLQQLSCKAVAASAGALCAVATADCASCAARSQARCQQQPSTHAHCCANWTEVLPAHSSGAGCCVGRMPKRFLQVMRSRENLSSGEKRAGWADLVGLPSGATFYEQGRRQMLLSC